MNTNAFRALERLTLLMAVVATLAALPAWGVRGAGATALGGALAWANLSVTGRIAGRAVGRVLAGADPTAVGLMAGMAFKMVLLFPVLWLSLSVLRVPLFPFALGLSVNVVSLLAGGLWTAAKGEAV